MCGQTTRNRTVGGSIYHTHSHLRAHTQTHKRKQILMAPLGYTPNNFLPHIQKTRTRRRTCTPLFFFGVFNYFFLDLLIIVGKCLSTKLLCPPGGPQPHGGTATVKLSWPQVGLCRTIYTICVFQLMKLDLTHQVWCIFKLPESLIVKPMYIYGSRVLEQVCEWKRAAKEQNRLCSRKWVKSQ